MRDALSRTELEYLREFTSTDVLLGFDYDGTLAPIVADPALAFIPTPTRDLLWRVSRAYPVVVVTGRAQADALRRLRGVGAREVIGNHGIEPKHAATRYALQVEDWHAALTQCTEAWPGVWLEDKIYSVAVHYRGARQREAARAAILACAATLNDARILAGKEVVNIIPRDAPDKGTALLREQERLKCSRAIYVGDDETDESVFAHSAPQRLLGIRVGESPDSKATHFIANQTNVDALLNLLLSLRPNPSGDAARAPERDED